MLLAEWTDATERDEEEEEEEEEEGAEITCGDDDAALTFSQSLVRAKLRVLFVTSNAL